jgi:hypothetical protein
MPADETTEVATTKKKEIVKKANGPVGSRSGNHTRKLFELNIKHKEANDPSIIQIRSADCQQILDSVDATYEDSFCLDTFKDLIIAHQQVGKHFIIARVQTWDRKQPEKAFYSYYNAYHLNKILFQTQWRGEKRLIHRLNVLNPLTNTDIIGDVQYFLVVTKYVAPVSDKVANLLAEVLVQNISTPNNTEEIDKKLPKRLKSTSEEVSFRLNYYVKKSLPPKLSIKTDFGQEEQGPELLLASANIDGDNATVHNPVIVGSTSIQIQQPDHSHSVSQANANETSTVASSALGDPSNSHSSQKPSNVKYLNNLLMRPSARSTPETSLELKTMSSIKKQVPQIAQSPSQERPRLGSKQPMQKAIITQFNEPASISNTILNVSYINIPSNSMHINLRSHRN